MPQSGPSARGSITQGEGRFMQTSRGMNATRLLRFKTTRTGGEAWRKRGRPQIQTRHQKQARPKKREMHDRSKEKQGEGEASGERAQEREDEAAVSGEKGTPGGTRGGGDVGR